MQNRSICQCRMVDADTLEICAACMEILDQGFDDRFLNGVPLSTAPRGFLSNA